MMLGMSQEKLGDALWPYVPASAEVRKGHEPNGGQPTAAGRRYSWRRGAVLFRRSSGRHVTHQIAARPSPAYIDDFVTTSDGLRLVKAFMRVRPAVQRRIVALVNEIAGGE